MHVLSQSPTLFVLFALTFLSFSKQADASQGFTCQAYQYTRHAVDSTPENAYAFSAYMRLDKREHTIEAFEETYFAAKKKVKDACKDRISRGEIMSSVTICRFIGCESELSAENIQRVKSIVQQIANAKINEQAAQMREAEALYQAHQTRMENERVAFNNAQLASLDRMHAVENSIRQKGRRNWATLEDDRIAREASNSGNRMARYPIYESQRKKESSQTTFSPQSQANSFKYQSPSFVPSHSQAIEKSLPTYTVFNGNYSISANAITPYVVAMAAHVADTGYVRVGSEEAVAVLIHRNWDRSNAEYDLALAIFENPIFRNYAPVGRANAGSAVTVAINHSANLHFKSISINHLRSGRDHEADVMFYEVFNSGLQKGDSSAGMYNHNSQLLGVNSGESGDSVLFTTLAGPVGISLIEEAKIQFPEEMKAFRFAQ